MFKSLAPDLNPDSISCDFELAVFIAINLIYKYLDVIFTYVKIVDLN